MRFSLLAFLFLGLLASVFGTALDDYVWAHDDHYGWVDTGVVLEGKSRPRGNFPGRSWKGYVLNMTSQQWLDESIVSRSIWWHMLVVIVPDQINYEANGTLWITGGSNENPMPSSTDEDILLSAELAMGIGAVTGALFQVPNEHIVFADDPIQKSRSEDAIIAYTWDHFMRNPEDSEWLLRLPMVKASLRAMDTITDWAAQNLDQQIDYYSVAGASKRGWTTWDVGAVDPDRVQLIVPIVLDAINFADVMHHQWRSYGGWAYALKDYYEMDIMTRLDIPETKMLQEIVDPYFYRERLTMPKLVVNAVGDEFQQPDDTWYWWNDMPEPKHFLMVPNAEHSLATGIFEATPAIGTWISYHLKKKAVPSFSWEISPIRGDITVQLDNSHPVHAVTMYFARSCSLDNARRDFRFLSIDDPCTCGIGVDGNCLNLHSLWQKEELVEDPEVPGKYVASRPFPKQKGIWEAFLVDVKYEEDEEPTVYGLLPTDKPGRLEFTTEVSVIPNTFPYDSCTNDECDGPLV